MTDSQRNWKFGSSRKKFRPRVVGMASCEEADMARKPAAPAKEAKAPKPDAIDPKHRWDRPIQAPGHTQVDFEERVDFRRLHDYRTGRVRRALAASGLGALLV